MPHQAPLTSQATLSVIDTQALTLRAIDDLRALGRKARTHDKKQLKAIADSIETFGFVVPVIVDEEGKVLAGNARIEAARLLGMREVPTVVLSHLSADQKRAFIIAENRLAELAGWDREVLRVELAELSALDLDFELSVIGFDEPQIDALVLGGEGGGERGDTVPPPSVSTVTRLGDHWILGEHRILCADALDEAALTRLMDGERARAVFTDPPYNVPVGGHVTGSKAHGEFVMASGEMSDAEFTAFLGKVWRQIATVLVEGGLAYLCMDWRHIQHVMEGLEGKGLEFINLVVWDKKVGGMGSFYRSRHELIFVVRNKGASHLNRVELGKHGRDRANVWTYDGVSGFGAGKARARAMHPTVKPLALVRDALLDCSARGDVVLDLFGGSGTSLIAAEDSRRRGRAIELDPRYVDVSVTRWQDYSGQEAILAATGETFADVRSRREGENLGEAA